MKSNLAKQTICFIGAGSMAEAIIRGIVEKKKIQPDRIIAVNRHNQNRLTELHRKYHIKSILESNAKFDAIQEADILVLGMKPKDVESAIAELRPYIKPQQLIVSVIAGLSIRSLSAILQCDAPIVRTMPNTSSTIGLGATGLSFSDKVTPEQKQMVLEIFQSFGIAREVEEENLDIVTGLSGSGPAYIYYMIEAMIEAGVEGGLEEPTARELAVQTVLGAAQMVKQTGEEPAILRQKVTSPGGTTQAALELMNEHGMGTIFKKAIHRSAERARELGAQMEKKG